MIALARRLPDALPSILDEYIDARELCPKQRHRMGLHVRKFREWCATQADLRLQSESAILSAWLADMATRYAGPTVNGYRQSIISLLRFATDDGEPLPRSDRIRRQREPDKLSPAFTRDEIRTMLAKAAEYQPTSKLVYGRGQHSKVVPHLRPDGVPWGAWWVAFVRAAYESGQYLADLSGVEWGQLRSDGVVTFVRKKTGRANSFRLSPEAIELCRAIGDPTYLLPWSYDRQSYFPRQFAKFVAFAGVRPLGAKSLRRSAITYTYMESGEEAAKGLAGHASFATTSKHYIDWSIASRPVVSPPGL